MDELRPEIRAAFEKEQAGLAPSAALRRNLVEAVAAQPRPGRNFQWVAVAAAVLLAILVVAGLMSTRLLARHANVNSPFASGAREATPVAGDYGPPPTGVNLLYVHDPDHASWLIAYDWSGQPRGTVKLSQPMPGMQMAPDGQAFLSAPPAKGGTVQFFDRLGQSISTPGTVRYTGGIWADDNRHLCSVVQDPNTLVYTLVTQQAGEAARPVADVAQDSNLGQTGVSIAACSFVHDQAILVRTTVASPSELWVISLSTGKVLSHHTYLAGQLVSVVASSDGQYVAESSSRNSGSLAMNSADSTVYRRVSDWTVVWTRPATEAVLAFSGDDSLALVSTAPLVSGQASSLATIDLRTGNLIWHDQGTATFGWFLARSGGTDFALWYRTGGGQNLTGDILIVHADGSVSKLPRPYQPTW